jgi:8-oxo-dGTP pyrophosphatase MutT (NUDIX family)
LSSTSEAFDLTPARPLTPADAVAAIVHCGDGNYLLQRRDAKRTIFYPDHWGFFGGAMEAGESPAQTLARELREELELDLSQCEVRRFSRFNFNVEPAGIAPLDRHYFDVQLKPDVVPGLRLGEGAAMELVDGRHALHALRMVPYDAFALWLHYYQSMLLR